MLGMMLALAITTVAQPAPRADDIAQLRDAKLRSWPDYYRRQDAAGLAAFLADGFVAMSADGSSESREEAVAWVRNNPWPNASNGFRYEISAIDFYGPDTANVYGTGSS